MAYKRGEIYLVDFNPAKGGEIGKLRPALIISDLLDNKFLATVVVLPLSTKIVPESYPYRIFIQKRDNLQKDSDICIYEIRALSKQRIKEKVAVLNEAELQRVQQALCELFGG